MCSVHNLKFSVLVVQWILSILIDTQETKLSHIYNHIEVLYLSARRKLKQTICQFCACCACLQKNVFKFNLGMEFCKLYVVEVKSKNGDGNTFLMKHIK